VLRGINARKKAKWEVGSCEIKFWGFLFLVSLPPLPVPSPPTLHYHNGEGLKLLGYPTTVTVPTACGLERQYKDIDVRLSDMLPIQKLGANGDEAHVSGLEKP
jgi:hypothetical protein